jgi:hypothetical protein
MGGSISQNFEDYYSKKRDRLLHTKERQRLEAYTNYLNSIEDKEQKDWRKWGCYLSERQWGTVRENYNIVDLSWGDGGQPATFPRDQALHRAYRWGEDGIAGISDDHQFLCFALTLWNGEDPCLKERLYGLTNEEGNHGEDVKEYYFYLDNTPTHSYMKYLYKYPYTYPYDELYNQKNSMNPYEFELVNTGAFSENRYFDVTVEYAKNDVEDICIKITATNCGPEQKTLHLFPTVWFRNTWSFKNNIYEKTLTYTDENDGGIKIEQKDTVSDSFVSQMWLYTQGDMKDVLFTENETDKQAAFRTSNDGRNYFKNGINQYILGKYKDKKNDVELAQLINPRKQGTKAVVHYELDMKPGDSKIVCLRLANVELNQPFDQFHFIFDSRMKEADDFYDAICPYDRNGNEEEKELYNIQRQAFSGMLWNKQFYYFVVDEWLKGDPKQPPPSEEHKNDAKLHDWRHLYCKDILLMPDKWEYPWFASWDLAFHTITIGIIDPEFAKQQLLLLVMEWYMHPNGQIPAYEWNFNNINPPVFAWATLSVYQQEKLIYGKEDQQFLERVFDKLNMNFTRWVNKEDSEGNNLFTGGFLGLDNIRIMECDPDGAPLEQADATAWMAMFCLNMMKIAKELKKDDLERKYLQHFIYICDAMNHIGDDGLWDEDAGFFFDSTKKYGRVPVYSAVGLIPLFVIEEIHANMAKDDHSESFYKFNGTLRWFIKNRPDLMKENFHFNIEDSYGIKENGNTTLEGFISMVSKEQLRRILEKVLDSNKFLSEFGIRSLSKDTNYIWYGKNICYEPAESNKVKLMGGNSNWRGPIWFPINYLLIESLRKFHCYLGDEYKVNYTEIHEQKNLKEVCDDLSDRLINIFRKDITGKRPVYGGQELFSRSGWADFILFYEYFHGDSGAGLGASHQTGWTGLIANIIQNRGVESNSSN